MSTQQTPDEVLADWDMRLRAGATYADMARELGLAGSRVARKRMDRYRGRVRSGAVEVAAADERPVFVDLKMPPTEDLMENYLDVLCRLQELDQQFDTNQLDCDVRLQADKPIGVVFSGDWHIGNKLVDYRRWREDCHLIRDEPGLYVGGMGDYGDNFLSGLAGKTINEVLARPEMQHRMVRHTVETTLGHKGLFWLLGNHNHWTDILSGLHPIQDLAAAIRNPFLKHGGAVRLTVGNVQYKLVVRHKFKGFSSLNKANEQRRLADESGGADVICVADKHFNHADLGTKAGRDYIWCRSGTYKILDDHSDAKVGVAEGDPRMPAVILWPGRKKMHYERDFRECIDYLRYLRK